MLRGVLFDFNGVLVDDEPLHFRLFRRVLAEEGVELDEATYYERYLGMDDRGALDAALSDAGRSADPMGLARLVARKAAFYQREIRREGYPFFGGALELVRDVAAAGWTLGVVSGALRDEVEGALLQGGVAELFKTLVTAEDVERGKPDPEGYRVALRALNAEPPLPARLVHPHEVLAIEDSAAGLAAATGSGLRTLGVAQSRAREVLTAAEAVVDRVAELSAARLAELFGD
ncbi:MAG: HAD family phosphatase [Acidobacteria bacterium]|nr:HAD family phosphatase [Acidobacteriota bacterium]